MGIDWLQYCLIRAYAYSVAPLFLLSPHTLSIGIVYQGVTEMSFHEVFFFSQ